MIFAGYYGVIAISTYINLAASKNTFKQMKSLAPTKMRQQISQEILKIERLKKYAILWPYVVYRLVSNR